MVGPVHLLQYGLPLLFILFIVVEIIFHQVFPRQEPRRMRRNVVRVFIVLNTLLLASVYPHLLQGPLQYRLPGFLGQGMVFQVDLLNYPFLLLAGLLWLLVCYYSKEDLHYLFFSLTYLATIGTFMAGDFLTFFLFFELMTLGSYFLMVYHQGEEQLEAGFIYLCMGLFGGLLLLSGVLLLVAYTGTSEWVSLAANLTELGPLKYVIAFFFLAGLGMKAGMVPFHFWMPWIYGRAPFAGVILSSAILVKAGAYAMLRVMAVTFSPGPLDDALFQEALWQVSENLGLWLLWMGVITMVFGALMALLQSNLKRLLAYSTISQMGYVIMGIGITAALGYHGVYGVAGTLYHMVNHALFKALVIMAAGAVYFATDELDLYRLGGLWKKMPQVAALAFIGLLGLTGMPGFNGYASKTLLHHGLLQLMQQGPDSLQLAEWLFKATGAGTVAYGAKFFYCVFLKKADIPLTNRSIITPFEEVVGPSRWMVPVMWVLASLVLVIGMAPGLFMDTFMIPGAMMVSRVPDLVNVHLSGFDFFSAKDLQGSALVLFLGLALYLMGQKLHIFNRQGPSWPGVERVLLHPVDSFCQRYPRLSKIDFRVHRMFTDAMIYAFVLVAIMGMMFFFRP